VESSAGCQGHVALICQRALTGLRLVARSHSPWRGPAPRFSGRVGRDTLPPPSTSIYTCFHTTPVPASPNIFRSPGTPRALIVRSNSSAFSIFLLLLRPLKVVLLARPAFILKSALAYNSSRNSLIIIAELRGCV
jgi:hypothetical protein